MKEIIRDLKTGKRRVNWDLILYMLGFVACIALIIHDVVYLFKGMSWTYFGFITFFMAVILADSALYEIEEEIKKYNK